LPHHRGGQRFRALFALDRERSLGQSQNGTDHGPFRCRSFAQASFPVAGGDVGRVSLASQVGCRLGAQPADDHPMTRPACRPADFVLRTNHEYCAAHDACCPPAPIYPGFSHCFRHNRFCDSAKTKPTGKIEQKQRWKMNNAIIGNILRLNSCISCGGRSFPQTHL
jgi:hypothetical protein